VDNWYNRVIKATTIGVKAKAKEIIAPQTSAEPPLPLASLSKNVLFFYIYFKHRSCVRAETESEVLKNKNIDKDDFDMDAIVLEINKKVFPNLYKLLQVAIEV